MSTKDCHTNDPNKMYVFMGVFLVFNSYIFWFGEGSKYIHVGVSYGSTELYVVCLYFFVSYLLYIFWFGEGNM